MTSAPDSSIRPPSDEAARHGIERANVEQFEFGGHRYTNIKDAVAGAARRQPPVTPQAAI